MVKVKDLAQDPKFAEIIDKYVPGFSTDKQLKLVVTDAAKNAIIDGGYDPIYGARPLKRYIQAHVETMIAKEIIAGAHAAGDTLTVDADENGHLLLR